MESLQTYPDRGLEAVSTDAIEQELAALEGLIGSARARQVTLLGEIDTRQVPNSDGCASLKQWTTGRLDVHPATAGELAFLAKTGPDTPEMGALAAGGVSFDRAAATARLRTAGATEDTLERSRGVAVTQIRRLINQHQLTTSRDEAEAFTQRYLYAQFSLDLSWLQLHGGLPGVDGERVLAGLDQRSDRLIPEHDKHRPTLAQRRADALVTWAMDELDTDPTTNEPVGGDGSHRLVGSIFIDATLAAPTCGPAGALTLNGLTVGPNTLKELLCGGTIDVTVIDNGQLKAVGKAGSAIPPRTRRYVIHRDGGCTADGCVSRYRLQPHHILERSHGGSDDPDNLVTLCWFHHHVVVHQRGYTIDPDSPPGRRRFTPPTRAPPHT